MGTPRVALLTLGCARNEVDSEELAGRLSAGGFALVEDADEADVVVVNTCGFIDAAKRESVETLLAAGGTTPDGSHRAVVAVGCMAERYGSQLAQELPEADAVLGFDHYPDIADRLRDIMDGATIPSHAPRDRRTLLPLAPVDRRDAEVTIPGHASAPGGQRAAGGLPVDVAGPGWMRRRIDRGPVASLKIASGCDRRCAFCAIPSFRGAFVSRPRPEVVAEARWLAEQGARELVLVSENSTSYGKDLSDPTALEGLLADLGEVAGIERVRVSYLQPAEVRPGLVRTMIDAPHVADHFDLSFQHASAGLLRRMRRFGGTESFLELISTIRAGAPDSGIRSNVIVGFPGETERDVEELIEFLGAAEMDAVGVFGYSDEDGTEAVTLPDKLDEDEIRARVEAVSTVADAVMEQRAEQRVGDTVEILIEHVDGLVAEGRAGHQGPEDGTSTVHLTPDLRPRVGPGSMLRARVVASDGVDLQAVEVSVVRI